MTLTFSRRRRQGFYQFEGFPEVLRDIVVESSFIRCNFSTASSHRVELALEKIRDFINIDRWLGDRIKEKVLGKFSTLPPLPEWAGLLLEELIPGWEEEISWNPRGPPTRVAGRDIMRFRSIERLEF